MNDHLLKIKTITGLNFEITKKNAHVLNEKDYIKMNTMISFEDLFWLIERVEKLEKERNELFEDRNMWIEGSKQQQNKIEKYEKAMNKSFLQIDLVHTDESDADNALNYVFKYLKEALEGSK